MDLPERWWLPVGAGVLAGGVGAVFLTRQGQGRSLLGGAVQPSAASRAALLAGLPPPPGGAQVIPKAYTGGSTWLADRYASLSRQGITGDQAHAIVALFAAETGLGAGEFCFNVGNYTAPSGTPLVYYVVPNGCTATGSGAINAKGQSCPVWWIAYTSLDAGVSDWIARVSKTWPTAWSELQSAPLTSTWVSNMASYYGGSTSTTDGQAVIASYVALWQTRLTQTAQPSA